MSLYINPQCDRRKGEADHESCSGTVTLCAGETAECDCPCHDEQAPQAEAIVRNLRRSGVRPGTVADLRRFELRMQTGKLGR